MVSGTTSALIAGFFAVLGSAITGVIAIFRSRQEQKAENSRLRAEKIAQRKADAIIELGIQLEKSRNVYDRYLRGAIRNSVDEEEFEKIVQDEYRELRRSIEESHVFLNDEGEEILWQFHDLLIDAEIYIKWKADNHDQFEFREGDIMELWRTEHRPEDKDFDFLEFQRMYDLSRQAIKKDVSQRIDSLEYMS